MKSQLIKNLFFYLLVASNNSFEILIIIIKIYNYKLKTFNCKQGFY